MPDLPTRVCLISPQPVVIEGFRAILVRHPHRVVVVDRDRLDSEPSPDVVLYDVIALAQGDGSDLDHLVKETDATVFAVSRDLRPDLLTQALNRGADGFFPLGVSEQDLLQAIDSAMTGWQPVDEAPDPRVGSANSDSRADALGMNCGLTPRETRILALISQGLTNDEVATRDFLSINSVKTYIRSAYAKIGVTSRSQAVAWAIRHGFASHEGPTTDDPTSTRVKDAPSRFSSRTLD